MDQVAGELSVVPAMCRCQKHRRHSLAHTHTYTHFPPPTPQIHKHGYRSKGAPHLQPPPNLMCFHLTLLIHCTHAHIWRAMLKFMNKHKWTSESCRHKHTHIWCAASSSTVLEELQHAPKSQYRVCSGTKYQYTGFAAIRWRYTHTHTHTIPPLLQISSFTDETHT